jgi:AraC-like DNA-binding protein
MTRYPHGILPPDKSFPKWQNRSGGELVYLGWGRRDYRSNPIAIHSNPGWSYFILRSGEARLLRDGEQSTLHPWSGFLAGPQCPYGFDPSGDAEVEIITWILRSPPELLDPVPAPTECRFFTFSQDEAERLNELCAMVRTEVFSGDPLADEALRTLCRLVEIAFARADRRSSDNNERTVLMRAARTWILEHLANERPVEDLAEYLKLSQMSLHRLVAKETGMPPGRYFRHLKMERCLDLLLHGHHSVKWVAYEMGYKHSNDFSRAFRDHFGASPRVMVARRKAEAKKQSGGTDE